MPSDRHTSPISCFVGYVPRFFFFHCHFYFLFVCMHFSCFVCMFYVMRFCITLHLLTSFVLIDPVEICSVIFHLKCGKSQGYDDISTKAVKAVTQHISNQLSEVFNVSLLTGEFPDNLKLAKVIPVYKTDDKLYVNNYTPQTNICFIGVLHNI